MSRPTWAECHAAGMSAAEAAAARGLSRAAARVASIRGGFKWKKVRSKQAYLKAILALIADGLWLREAARRLGTAPCSLSKVPLPPGVTWPPYPGHVKTKAVSTAALAAKQRDDAARREADDRRLKAERKARIDAKLASLSPADRKLLLALGGVSSRLNSQGVQHG